MTRPLPTIVLTACEKTVYAPREDSFLLSRCLPAVRDGRVLDVGCGSGIAGLSAAAQGAREVWFSDINPDALRCAQKNATANSFAVRYEFRLSDLFSQIPESFDAILFNPPYVPSDDIRWIDTDGGKAGREVLDRFLTQASRHLTSGGVLCFVQSDHNKFAPTRKMLSDAGLSVKIAGRQRLFFEELLVVHARAP